MLSRCNKEKFKNKFETKIAKIRSSPPSLPGATLYTHLIFFINNNFLNYPYWQRSCLILVEKLQAKASKLRSCEINLFHC